MAAIFYLDDATIKAGRKVADDRDADRLLQEIRSKTGEDWILVVSARRIRQGIFGHRIEKEYDLYADAHSGEWQRMAPGMGALARAGSREFTMAFMRGLLSGLESKRSISRPVTSMEASQDAKPLARWQGGLELGLHRVHWRSGGSSLCAVGMGPDGRRWLAPVNWTEPSTDPHANFWSDIERTELLFPYPEERP